MKALRHILELFQLTLPFQLSTPHSLLCHLPNEAFFELEETPGLRHCLFPPIQTDQEEIGQDRQRDRARHPLFVVRHLHLAEVQSALEFLYGDFHTPPPRVDTEHGSGTRLGQIGHEDLDALRPIVTPFFGQYNRDIPQIMERSTAEKDPVVAAAPVRFVTGAAGITALREVLDQVTEMFAMRKFGCVPPFTHSAPKRAVLLMMPA